MPKQNTSFSRHFTNKQHAHQLISVKNTAFLGMTKHPQLCPGHHIRHHLWHSRKCYLQVHQFSTAVTHLCISDQCPSTAPVNCKLYAAYLAPDRLRHVSFPLQQLRIGLLWKHSVSQIQAISDDRHHHGYCSQRQEFAHSLVLVKGAVIGSTPQQCLQAALW